MGGLDRFERHRQFGRAALVLRPDQRVPTRKRLAYRLGQASERRMGAQHRPEQRHRFLPAPETFERIRLHHHRRDVIGVGDEGLVEAAERRLEIAGQIEGLE